MRNRVLCVDDDPNILAGFQRNLRKQFELDIATGGEAALALLDSSGPYSVIVADMQMPGMHGVELLQQVEAKHPDTVRIMLTGNADQGTAVEAVNQGHVFRFLNKPCSPEALAQALEAGIQQYHLLIAEKELLEKTLKGSLKVLSDILAAVDPVAFGRGQVLRDQLRSFLKHFGVCESWKYEVAAMLSQIGHVTVPPVILKKARANALLTGEEKDILARVPETGSALLASIPRLEEVALIILYQQKNFDGTGFPVDYVKGEQIPLLSRILRVLSDLIQLQHQHLPTDEALMKMQKHAGRYDPRVLDAAFACFDAYLPTSSTAKGSELRMHMADLRPGHWLLSDIETLDGTLLLAAGNQLTAVMLDKIRNFSRTVGIKEPIQVDPAH